MPHQRIRKWKSVEAVSKWFSNREARDPAPVLQWIRTAATAVANYYGHFPVRRLTVRVESTDGNVIESGRTFAARDGGGLIKITVGRSTTAAHFDQDWLMTHEMTHLAFPSVSDQHHWIEEGLATYLEPIERARIGRLRAERVWADVVGHAARFARAWRSRARLYVILSLIGEELIELSRCLAFLVFTSLPERRWLLVRSGRTGCRSIGQRVLYAALPIRAFAESK
jgi:hypothetical protein